MLHEIWARICGQTNNELDSMKAALDEPIKHIAGELEDQRNWRAQQEQRMLALAEHVEVLLGAAHIHVEGGAPAPAAQVNGSAEAPLAPIAVTEVPAPGPAEGATS